MYIGVDAGSELVPEERWLSCDSMRLVGCRIINMLGLAGVFTELGPCCIVDMSMPGMS
jgi:hypothetical protein